MVPASEVADLRADVADMKTKLTAAEHQIAALEGQLGQTLMEREWWREQYREAKVLLDRAKIPAP